jgi:DnaJ-class molecular chaperone
MARRKKKARRDEISEVITGFAKGVDTAFEMLTGKSMATWFKEFGQPPRELPAGEQAALSEPGMPLADAYAIMGLPPTASIDEVKERYRALARLFHPDAPGGYSDAMRLLNNARDRIMKEKKI